MKVDAFLYGESLLPPSIQGTAYDNLFHVSDWFPTILSMAGIGIEEGVGVSFTPQEGYELDGVDHFETFKNSELPPPRSFLLMNYYYDPSNPEATYMTTIPMAIRDKQYKLIHTYESKYSSDW